MKLPTCYRYAKTNFTFSLQKKYRFRWEILLFCEPGRLPP
ncbi:hypothetical protein AWT69_003078 [Pseudomonas putida]|nr:hypothetical protein AWT69_003078 [Pseudomonas putida]